MTEHQPGARTTNGYEDGCRCDGCRGTHRRRSRKRKLERFDERVEINGRLVAVNAFMHGHKSTYANWGCRCEPCTEANAEYLRQWRAPR